MSFEIVRSRRERLPVLPRASFHFDHAESCTASKRSRFFDLLMRSLSSFASDFTEATILAHCLSMAFSFELNRRGHVHRVLVSSYRRGWEIVVQQDSIIVERTYREDWHKVERDIALFQTRIFACGADGWPVLPRREAA